MVIIAITTTTPKEIQVDMFIFRIKNIVAQTIKCKKYEGFFIKPNPYLYSSAISQMNGYSSLAV